MAMRPPSGVLAAGQWVLLHDRMGRHYRVRLEAGGETSLHSGQVVHDELIGAFDGSLVRTSKGMTLLALRPTLAEWVTQAPRQAQPIYPKDVALILMLADLGPGSRVMEAGVGAGALTMSLLRAVGPSGQVYSYEIREDFGAQAQASVRSVIGEVDNWSLRIADVSAEIEQTELDAVLLDLPEPWTVVPLLGAALRPGGTVFAHCPNVTQVVRFGEALRGAGGFGMFRTVESLVRDWTVRGRSVRPSHRMVAHTGFLSFARRLAGSLVFEPDRERL